MSTTGGAGASEAYQGTLFTQQRVKSYADIVTAPAVLQPVIKDHGLDTTPTRLAEKISTEVPLDTVLISIAVQDTSPARARNIANSVGAQFASVVTELETTSDRPRARAPVKVSLVKPANTPRAPVFPRPTVNYALGVLIGLAVGVGAAVLREILDTSVKTADDLTTLTGRGALASIAYDADASDRPLIVHADPRSPRAEAFRTLRTNLQFVDVDRPPRSVVVTSALAEEGKSTTSVNLAIALSQAGLRVALVEGDLRRPRIADYLRVEGAVGLTDVLVGQVSVHDVLQPWGRDKLYVLPSGPVPPNPSEMLGSQQMVNVLAHLAEMTDMIIVDAPPLLPVTDAAVLARVCDGAVLVARHRHVRAEQVRAAVAALEAVDARLLGTVLSMAPLKGPGRQGVRVRVPLRAVRAHGPPVHQRRGTPGAARQAPWPRQQARPTWRRRALTRGRPRTRPHTDGDVPVTPLTNADASSSDGRQARHASARR